MRPIFKLLLVVLLIVPILLWLWVMVDFREGEKAYKRGDYATAYQEWLPFAAQGHAGAQANPGAMHAEGIGVPQDDAEAVKWFRKAAEQGDAGAQFNLGAIHANGDGVPQDDAEAAKWFRKAAEQGDADAQTNLGLRYANGVGVPEDYVRAFAWLNLAAAEGIKPAKKYKDTIRRDMTAAQIAEAQELSASILKRIRN